MTTRVRRRETVRLYVNEAPVADGYVDLERQLAAALARD